MTEDMRNCLAAAIACPAEDTPRLMFADACDESGDPAHARRAAFVRAQIDLSRLGPPHTAIYAHARLNGRNCYAVDVDGRHLNGAGFEVGQRVDLAGMWTPTASRAMRNPWRGLVVERIDPLDMTAGVVTLHLRRDAASGSYPADKAKVLKDLLRANCGDWGSWLRLPHGHRPSPVSRRPRTGAFTALCHTDGIHRGHTDVNYWLQFTRGFPDRVTCGWDVWRYAGAALCAWNPIAAVNLYREPPVEVHRMPEEFCENRFTLVGDSHATTAITRMSDNEYNHLGEEAAEGKIVRDLLRTAYPTVHTWTFGLEDDADLPPLSDDPNDLIEDADPPTEWAPYPA